MGRGGSRRNLPVTRCEDLLPREREILRLLAEGKTSAEIARELNLSLHTINHVFNRDHPSSIYPIIGVDSRIAAALWYDRNCKDPQEHTSLREPEPYPQEQESGSPELEPHFFSFFRGVLTATFICVLLFIFVPLPWTKNVKSFPYLFSNIFAVLPAIAGGYGLIQYRRLTHNNGFRRIIWWLSVGLILWAVGQILWVLWIVMYGDDIPFPSPADIGYLSSAIFLVIGLYILRHEVARETHQNQYIAWSVSSILLIISVIVTLWARHGKTDLEADPLKLILQLAYPTVDVVAFGILISILLAPSFQWLDSEIKWMVCMATIGIIVLYIADTSFSVTTSFPEDNPWTFYNGAPPDVAFTTAFWILGLALTWIPDWYRSETTEA